MAVDLGADSTMRKQIARYCSTVRHNAELASAGQKTDDAALRQLSMQMSSLLLRPIESHIARRLVIHASEELNGLPVHALVLPNGGYASATYDISYAPLLNSPGMHASEPPLKNVVVIGAPSSGSLEMEYELRSIKNFYPDASVLVTQLATEKNFRDAQGDVLHLSTFYGRDTLTDRSTFALAGGSITMPETFRPISAFLLARPFRMWIIADLDRDTSMTSTAYAMFAMMSGASQCLLQRFTCASATSKEFNEYFYTSLLAHGDGKTAYRDAMLQLQKKHAADGALATAPFFLMEW
jgi:hypothetical protein